MIASHQGKLLRQARNAKTQDRRQQVTLSKRRVKEHIYAQRAWGLALMSDLIKNNI